MIVPQGVVGDRLPWSGDGQGGGGGLGPMRGISEERFVLARALVRDA